MATLGSAIPSPRSKNQRLSLNASQVALLVAVLTATSCSNQTTGAAAPAPVAVQVVEVEQRDVPIFSEWIGTLDGMVNADIKAQVTGYLLEQAYQ